MNINPISAQYYRISTAKCNLSSVSYPVTSQKFNTNKLKYPSSFCGLIPNTDLIKSGYKVAQIDNNKISNNDNCIMITSADKFLAIQNSPNTWNKKFVLSKDIDLNGAEIKPIGNATRPFKGEFDGNGCSISNFKINCPQGRNIGLFGKCENAKISNLEIENAFIKGKQQVGGVAGCASNSEFKDCFFQGYIDGLKNVGGLLGISHINSIEGIGTKITTQLLKKEEYNPFSFNDEDEMQEAIGGLIGSDDQSTIKGSYSESILHGSEQIGGLIGYATNSFIRDSLFKGIITGDSRTGGLIGWAENCNLSKSYSLSNKNDFIGTNINNTTLNLYNSLEELVSPDEHWNSDFWNAPYCRLPRLKIQEKRKTSEEIFLEDLNTDIKTGNISIMKNFDKKVKEKVKINLIPPRHYDNNNELLDKIKKSKDNRFLRTTFGELVSKIRCEGLLGENSSDKYDELLVALIQNKNLDINSTYSYETDDLNDDRWYNIYCSPLFILTCLNKAYPLKEALKRDDADFTIGSGFAHNETILNQAFKHHIDDCAYVLLTEPKMQDYINERIDNLKANNLSSLGKLLLECYPDNIPPFNKENSCIEFSKEFDYPKELLEQLTEIQTLEQAQKLCILDANYKDSMENNIVNIASTLEKPEEALRILIAAKKIGTDINNLNKKSESPFGHGIYTNKPHFVAQMLDGTSTPFVRIADGTDAMLLFSKMPEENYSINYMDAARKKGLSINTCDKNGTTPLINAIKLKHHNTIKYLLANGANPNQADNGKQTPLHHACINNDIETINMLLDSYAYPNVKDVLGSLPFEYLDENLKNMIEQKLENQKILYQTSGLSEDVTLKTENYNLDDYNRLYSLNEISKKVLNGDKTDKEILQLTKNLLLNPQAIYLTDDNCNSALHIASRSASPYAKECLKIAIEKGIDINKTNINKETALMGALEAYLYADTDEERITLMQNIKFLLNNNPNVDITNNNKQSALHRICQSGNLILFNEILKLDPKINQVDKNGNTPFEYIPKSANEPMYITAKEYLKNNKIIKGE